MTADTVGGVWTFALELCDALAERGITVTLATLGGPPTDSQLAEVSQIPRLRLRASNFKLEWMEDPWRDVEESGRWLLEMERECAPDVVHLNSFGHGSLPWRSPVVLTAHSCVASWWKAVRREPLPTGWGRYVTTVQRSLLCVDRIVAPSAAMLQTLPEDYGLFPAGAEVILNGRRASRFWRQEKEPFLLAAGRLWDRAKGIDTLVQAASDLPWPVYLAGEPQSNHGGALPPSRCRLLGRLCSEELAGYYACSAIYVLPARYEPFGLSALEAALSGCALVLGDIPSLREIWEDAATLVPPDDPIALGEALRELIANTSLREEMAQQAFLRAQQFTPDRMASGYLAAYGRTMNDRSMKEEYACVS